MGLLPQLFKFHSLTVDAGMLCLVFRNVSTHFAVDGSSCVCVFVGVCVFVVRVCSSSAMVI